VVDQEGAYPGGGRGGSPGGGGGEGEAIGRSSGRPRIAVPGDLTPRLKSIPVVRPAMPSTEPLIQGLSAVTVHISDVARARHFYTDVLGLQEKEFQAERQRLVYALPGTSAVLTMHVMTDPREEGRLAGTVSGIVFACPDPASMLNELRRRGGTVVTEAMKMPWGLVRGVFADPDGNEFIVAASR